MKKLLVVALGCLLTSSAAFAGETSPSDQKWLAAVEQMVAEGQTTIATPNEVRVNLLKEWAVKNGYSVNVAKIDKGFSAKVSKKLTASR